MQIIIAMEKKRFCIFLRIHSHKREYLHNMHSISANKTATMYDAVKKKSERNTLRSGSNMLTITGRKTVDVSAQHWN